MLIECNRLHKDKLLEYVDEDFRTCVYLYLNLKEIAFENENVKVWSDIDSGSQIHLVVLSYYDCLHLFSRDNLFNKKELLDMIFRILTPHVIFMPEVMLPILNDHLIEEYDSNLYSVMTTTKRITDIDTNDVTFATLSDMEEIANLIISDEVFSRTYIRDSLAKQMAERYKSGFTRHSILKQKGKIVAHYATLAESGDLAISGLFIVDKLYRGKGYGKKVATHLFKTILNENKIPILFPANNGSMQFHKKLGFNIVGRIAKFTKKNKL